MRQNREQQCYIFEFEAAECIDQAAQQLLFCYILKIVMTVEWRLNWDTHPERHAHMSLEGKQRDGPGTGPKWDESGGQSPPDYCPSGDNKEVDMQVSQLLNLAGRSAAIPESFWRNDSAEGIAAKVAANVYNKDDIRAILVLKLIRAMHSKRKCSFIHPRVGQPEEPDVYYFPEGAAFTSEKKPNSFVAASVLAQNPLSKMPDGIRMKGLEYQKMSMLTDALGKAKAQTKASSSSSQPTMKRPAAESAGGRTSSKRLEDRELDEMD